MGFNFTLKATIVGFTAIIRMHMVYIIMCVYYALNLVFAMYDMYKS